MCATFGANRSSRLTASTDFWICAPSKTPHNAPGILRGELYLANVHSQTNPQTFTKFGANQSSCLTASQDFWICDPPPKPPGLLRSELYLAYVHSQTNLQIFTNFGANRSSRLISSQNIWICDPLKPPEMTLGYCGRDHVSWSFKLVATLFPGEWVAGYPQGRNAIGGGHLSCDKGANEGSPGPA